ncbi:NAD kinase [Facklamia sp. P12945]|uniref:NAD kinase n=1 Tax=unclassified Facklamia TaxID=2622293 RepID=UPI003D175457
MKKIGLVYNKKALSVAYAQRLKTKLHHYQLKELSNGETPDYVISIGGDGTLLSAFHQYQAFINHTQFIGIHTGHLGFYTDWLGEQMDQVLQSIVENDAESISYPLLSVAITLGNGKKRHVLALNECSIRSHRKTMVCDVEIKDQFFETFRGDGLCIATPTGSTGLNKSLGGAVMHPRIEAIQMTEMASVNNRVYRSLASPIILPADEWLTLKPDPSNEWMDITTDHLFWADQTIDTVRLQLAKERIHFASFKHMHYWNRVESSFIANQVRK